MRRSGETARGGRMRAGRGCCVSAAAVSARRLWVNAAAQAPNMRQRA